ncbi:phosphotransferase enzyme family protein [Aspergillus pseudoustus]|uniref:Altered inheritance of mitochondria protein 9, mitochondrial n=1 Tax=Aspergillus pseudoustus TaxID=1810923 RepID=A0ABR4JHX4_9EURO
MSLVFHQHSDASSILHRSCFYLSSRILATCYSTTSILSTVTFLCSKGIPVPEVYGWSSTTDNPVGVEYIIMEHAAGVGADTVWFNNTKYQKKELAPLYESGTPDEAGDSKTYFADKEINWVQKFGEPIESEFPHNTVFPGVRFPQGYLELLRKERAHSLSQPVLRYPDLTPSNVFIDPDTVKVTSIIDWQHTIITPMQLAAGYPGLFENPDAVLLTALVPPKSPPNYKTMSPEEKAQVDERIRRQSLFYLYHVFNDGLNKVHLEALRDPLLLRRQNLVDLAGRQWSGNIISLCNDTPLECPIGFSGQELQEKAEDESMWYKLNELVHNWRYELGGLSEQDWLPAEKYEAALNRNESLKAEFAHGDSPDEVEKIERGWPFQDREEFF